MPAATTFACPECGKVLQSAKPISAGKKIKCPSCATIFPMPEREDEELAAGVSTKPRRPAVAPADTSAILAEAAAVMRDRFGIEHATLQVEPAGSTACAQTSW